MRRSNNKLQLSPRSHGQQLCAEVFILLETRQLHLNLNWKRGWGEGGGANTQFFCPMFSVVVFSLFFSGGCLNWIRNRTKSFQVKINSIEFGTNKMETGNNLTIWNFTRSNFKEWHCVSWQPLYACERQQRWVQKYLGHSFLQTLLAYGTLWWWGVCWWRGIFGISRKKVHDIVEWHPNRIILIIWGQWRLYYNKKKIGVNRVTRLSLIRTVQIFTVLHRCGRYFVLHSILWLIDVSKCYLDNVNVITICVIQFCLHRIYIFTCVLDEWFLTKKLRTAK